jgi:hypothetical protein
MPRLTNRWHVQRLGGGAAQPLPFRLCAEAVGLCSGGLTRRQRTVACADIVGCISAPSWPLALTVARARIQASRCASVYRSALPATSASSSAADGRSDGTACQPRSIAA